MAPSSLETREVKTQDELDKALADGVFVLCVGSGYFEISGSSTVTAYGSSTVTASDSSTVTASDSSTVTASDSSTVRAYGSSTVRAYGSSTVRAYGSSTVTASDSSTVTAYGSSTVRAGKYVAVHNHGGPTITGGVVIDVPRPSNATEWCEYRDVEITEIADKPAVVLMKAVRGDYRSARSGPNGYVFYTPGSTPVADDWDGGMRECGAGLHFCARTWESVGFVDETEIRYLACPIWLEDISVHEDPQFPQKVKARGLCAPCWEVDADGERVTEATS